MLAFSYYLSCTCCVILPRKTYCERERVGSIVSSIARWVLRLHLAEWIIGDSIDRARATGCMDPTSDWRQRRVPHRRKIYRYVVAVSSSLCCLDSQSLHTPSPSYLLPPGGLFLSSTSPAISLQHRQLSHVRQQLARPARDRWSPKINSRRTTPRLTTVNCMRS